VGTSAYSNAVQVSTPAPPPPAPTVPNAPGALSAQAVSSTEVALTWQDNSSNETAFRVERLVGGAWQEILTVGINVTSVRSGGLAPSTAYQFRVRAGNAVGTSAYSNAVQVSTLAAPAPPPPPPPVTAPAAPTKLTLRWLGNGTVEASWRDNSNNETQFTVERMVNGVYQASATVGANVTTALAGSLKSRASYTFRVRVANASGSTYGSPANINTP
jgi:hypothetical protein